MSAFGLSVVTPAVEGEFAPIPQLHPALDERLRGQGIEALYAHQAEAYDLARSGRDIVVVTGTNSGKTLCYNLPTLQKLMSEPAARALYIFPTKALAQDQLSKIEELSPKGATAATYDGDTPQSHRATIRKTASVVLTNPDMLHIGILPSHELWTKFFRSLRVIVLDEMHVYRGVFGSHTANVLRRLLRICEWHGSRPQIIACSATIGNPRELFQRLTGREASLVDRDTAPKARRTYVFFNPPHANETERMSSNVVTAQMLVSMAEAGVRSLAFCRARVTVELVLQQSQRYAAREGIVPPGAIDAYRGGYTAKERRQVEKALFKGELLSLVATNALELGVDIGGLDAVILNGYPGSIAAFRQQAGRAGRGSRPGLAVFVPQDEPLEQFLVREPHRLLESEPETVAINPQNPHILQQHIECAAQERPLTPTELDRFGPTALDTAEELDRSGILRFNAGLFFYPRHDSPAVRTNIRGTGSNEVRLLVEGEELGTMELRRALQYAHEGAVYLHRGATYRVLELDLGRSLANLEPFKADYYTQPVVQASIEPLASVDQGAWGSEVVLLAAIRVTDLVLAYKMKSIDGSRILDVVDLDLPPQSFETLGVRLDVASPPHEDVGRAIGGIHGAEHALMAVAPLIAGCDRDDLGSTWMPVCSDTLRPAIYVFDRAPGGVGLSEALFNHRGAWASAAGQLLSSCPCVEGCPSCLLSSRCESGNEALHKEEAKLVLARLA